MVFQLILFLLFSSKDIEGKAALTTYLGEGLNFVCEPPAEWEALQAKDLELVSAREKKNPYRDNVKDLMWSHKLGASKVTEEE